MKCTEISYEIVNYIPEIIEEGIVYISEPYKTAVHKCCCGCGEEVVTPLTPTDWKATITHNRLTLYPSIGNWSFACQSHYWIREGRIIWSTQLSAHQINRIRQADSELKADYFQKVNNARRSPILKLIDEVVQKFKEWLSGK